MTITGPAIAIIHCLGKDDSSFAGLIESQG
jgi:hypothetical protein